MTDEFEGEVLTLTDGQRTVTMNTGDPDEWGTVYWYGTEIGGWDSTGDDQVSVLDRSSGNGVRVTRERKGGRYLVVEGVAVTASPENAYSSRDAMMRMLRQGNVIGFTVDEATRKHLLVRRGGVPKMPIEAGVMPFQLVLLAEQPEKRGDLVREYVIAAGQQVIVNSNGTAKTPYWTLTGNGTGRLAVRVRQRTMSTKGTVTGLVLDRAASTVTVNGVLSPRVMTSETQWLEIEPGPQVLHNTGTLPVTLRMYDAFE